MPVCGSVRFVPLLTCADFTCAATLAQRLRNACGQVAYGKNENSGKALAFGEHSQKFKPLGLRDWAGSQEARPARVSGISWMSGISGIGGIGGISGISGISLGGFCSVQAEAGELGFPPDPADEFQLRPGR